MFQVLYFRVQVVVAGTSKNYQEETVVTDVLPASLHPSNVQVFYVDTEMRDTLCSLHKRIR